MGIIQQVKIVCSAIMLFGLFPYLYYRDRMNAYGAFGAYIVCFIVWGICIIEKPWPQKLGWIVLCIGASCNQLAIWSNGGKMPVKDVFEPHGLWRPMVESDRLKFLCDIYWSSTSIGDLIAMGGFALVLILGFIF